MINTTRTVLMIYRVQTTSHLSLSVPSLSLTHPIVTAYIITMTYSSLVLIVCETALIMNTLMLILFYYNRYTKVSWITLSTFKPKFLHIL